MKINENIENNNSMKNSNNNNNEINENNNINLEERKDTQFYLITLEDSNGEHQQIRIFKNSDPSEIAFNFCKDNNLDFKSMKYIQKNIEKIIKQFDEPNHKLFFLDNSYSSIQELEEENLGSENTFKSKNSIINENNYYKDKNYIAKNNNENNINNINDIKGNFEESVNRNNIEEHKGEKNFGYDAGLNSKNEFINTKINNNNNLNTNNTKESNNKKDNKNNIIVKSNKDEGNNNNLTEENIFNKSIKNKNSIAFNEKKSVNEDNLNINLCDKKNIIENNNLNIIKEELLNNQSQLKIKEKIKDFENNNETLVQNNKGMSGNILVKKIKKHNSKVNFIKINTHNKKIKKENLSNLNHKENSINQKDNTSKINQNIYVKSKIQKLFKCINPKQHLINEEYKIIKNKDLNRENNNRIDKNKHIMNKTQKIRQKSKEKLSGKNGKDSRTNITFTTTCNSNINLKKQKFENYNVHNINTNNNNYLKNIKKNQSILESFPCLQNNDKSSIKKSNNLFPKESDSKKNKEKINYNRNTYTPSNLFLKINKKSSPDLVTSLNNPNKNNYSKTKEKQTTRNKRLDKLKSYTFIAHYPKTINKHNLINQNSFIQNKEKQLLKNKRDLNKIQTSKKNVIFSKKKNGISHYIYFKKRNGALEESQSKSKKISEIKNGLSKIFNNFQGTNNILLNTDYIINKRCRMINSKDKKNMSMNLSRHIHDFNKKARVSPKYKLEIKISNNNLYNLNMKDNQKNSNQKTFYNKNSKANNNILINNFNNSNSDYNNNNLNYQYDIMDSKKRKFYNRLINTHSLNQFILQKHNTSINSKSRIFSSVGSNNKIKKKILFEKKGNNTKNNSFFSRIKNRSSRNKEKSNNLHISNSFLTSHDRSNKVNDYCLDQYYTINNTINITNNNSLLNSFSNNNNITIKKHYITENKEKINNIKYIFNNLFQFFDKENNGFFIMNYKQKINEISDNMKISIESKKIFAKMIKILFEINKNNKSLEIGKEKIIINKNIFMKYMIYIFHNKLSINEKTILSEAKREIDKAIKKDFILNNFRPNSSFNKYKINSDYLSSYNYSSKLNKLKENISINIDIKGYSQKKVKKSTCQKEPKYKSFNGF